MRALPLLSLVLVTACRGVGAPDVARSFEREIAQVRLRLPQKTDLAPARVEAGDMAETAALAEQFLAEHPGLTMSERYVRALLACVHLMRGDNLAARDLMADVTARREEELAHENQVINATLHAISASRAVDARNALERVYEDTLTFEEFVRQYGSFVAIVLPDPGIALYDEMVRRHAAQLRDLCFAEVSGDPREMEEVDNGRTDLHRLIGEQLYNDTVALLGALPTDRSTEADWLRFTAVGSFVSFGYLFHEVVPMRLGAPEKEWQLEQSYGMFKRVKAVAQQLRGRPEYASIEKKLLNAEIEIRGWIETR